MFKEQCCKQCRHAQFKGTMTKRPVKQTHRTAHKHVNTKTQQTLRKNYSVTALVRLMTFIGGVRKFK